MALSQVCALAVAEEAVTNVAATSCLQQTSDATGKCKNHAASKHLKSMQQVVVPQLTLQQACSADLKLCCGWIAYADCCLAVIWPSEVLEVLQP